MKDIGNVNKLIAQLTATSQPQKIEEIALELGKLDNEATSAALKEILSKNFPDSDLLRIIAILEDIKKGTQTIDQVSDSGYPGLFNRLIMSAAETGADAKTVANKAIAILGKMERETKDGYTKQSIPAVINAIKKGFSPKSLEASTALPLPTDEKNSLAALQVATLLKGLFQRSVYNKYNVFKDTPTQRATGFTRLEMAIFSAVAAELFQERLLAPAPTTTPVTTTLESAPASTSDTAKPDGDSKLTDDESLLLAMSLSLQVDIREFSTDDELELDNIVLEIKQLTQEIKDAKNDSTAVINIDAMKSQLIELEDSILRIQKRINFSRSTGITFKDSCDEYQSFRQPLSQGKIPEELGHSPELEKLKKLAQRYELGKSGGYFSLGSWVESARLFITKRQLATESEKYVDGQIDSLNSGIDKLKKSFDLCILCADKISGLLNEVDALEKRQAQMKTAIIKKSESLQRMTQQYKQEIAVLVTSLTKVSKGKASTIVAPILAQCKKIDQDLEKTKIMLPVFSKTILFSASRLTEAEKNLALQKAALDTLKDEIAQLRPK